jgi:hypothetical protein
MGGGRRLTMDAEGRETAALLLRSKVEIAARMAIFLLTRIGL